MADKYGIVTGASRGLGEAIAEELAREGYNVSNDCAIPIIPINARSLSTDCKL